MAILDQKTGKARSVGLIRSAKTKGAVYSVWGIIWDGRKVYALTSSGGVFQLDEKTAVATPLFTTRVNFYGRVRCFGFDRARMPPQCGPMDVAHELELLIRARTRLVVIESFDEARVHAVVRRVARKLSRPLYEWTLTEGLTPAGGAPLYDSREPLKALGNVVEMKRSGVYVLKDLASHLLEPTVARKVKDLIDRRSTTAPTLVVVAPKVDLPDLLIKHAARLDLSMPSDKELGELVWHVISHFGAQSNIDVRLNENEFQSLIEGLRGLTLAEAERAIGRAVADDLALTPEDVPGVLSAKREILEADGAIEYVPNNIGFDDIGGLASLKAWLMKRRDALTPEAKAFGLDPPKGVVLLGVQGCGKSLAARAVAAAWHVPLLRMEPGRIYDKYIGESDKHLEQALRAAEHMAPCVLWVDEIEKGFASVGNTESDGGLSRRIFGRLLGWLQDRKKPVFVVATCNDAKSLPPELMRKGRFDEVFFVDLPTDAERVEIFRVHLAQRGRDAETFDLQRLAQASEGFSGAEIEQAVVAGLYTAFAEKAKLDTEMIVAELEGTRPLSVTRAEDVRSLRVWAEGRTVRAG